MLSREITLKFSAFVQNTFFKVLHMSLNNIDQCRIIFINKTRTAVFQLYLLSSVHILLYESYLVSVFNTKNSFKNKILVHILLYQYLQDFCRIFWHYNQINLMNLMNSCVLMKKLQVYMYFINSILIFFKTHLYDIFLLPKIHTKYFSTEI